MNHEEWLKEYGCEKEDCIWWGFPQYGGICCYINKECKYTKKIKKVKQKLIDSY